MNHKDTEAQKHACLGVLLFLWLLPAAALAQNFAELERAAAEELASSKTPGAAVAVIRGDTVIFAKGFGVASVETGAPVTPDMLFRLGSTTKMLTAAVLAGLAADGRLKLDEPVGKYVKGLSPGLAKLTAHQLLSHTAGLKDEAPMNGLHDDSALGARVRAWTDAFLIFEPGRVYSYSNPGYTLAGLLIEEAGGKPYADMMSERLFQPAGMKRTTLRPTMAMTYPLAQGHAVEKEKPVVIRPAADYAGAWPAGSVFSSVNDLSRFVIAFLNDGKIEGKDVLSPGVISRMSAPHVETHGNDDGHYGYGLASGRWRGVRVVQHGGSRAGYGSTIRMAPEQRVAAIALGNRSGSGMPKTMEKAMELMLPRKAAAFSIEEAKLPSALPPTLTMTAAEMSQLAGVYANGATRVEIYARDGKLYRKLQDVEVEVIKVGNSRFAFLQPDSGRPTRFAILTGPDGRGEYLHSGGRAHRRMSR